MNHADKQTLKELDIHDLGFWWDKSRFVVTLIFCGAIYAGLMLWIERVKPPENHSFERLPAITGEWWSGDCQKGQGYSCARIGDVVIWCSLEGYYPFGTGSRGNCNHLKIPNGEIVTAEIVKTPTANGFGKYFSIFSTKTKIYRSDSDFKIRDMWIREAQKSASGIFFIFFIIIYFVLLATRKTHKE
jgi:hypothetical protein